MRHWLRFKKEWKYHTRLRMTVDRKLWLSLKWTWILRKHDIKDDLQ